MPTQIKDIADNKVESIDLRAICIGKGYIDALVEALEKNTSAKELNLFSADLIDADLVIIIDALIKRPARLASFDISYNEDLSEEIIPNLVKLMESGKIDSLNLAHNGFVNNEKLMKRINAIAQSHHVAIVLKINVDYQGQTTPPRESESVSSDLESPSKKMRK